jgi:hypothetical protein
MSAPLNQSECGERAGDGWWWQAQVPSRATGHGRRLLGCTRGRDQHGRTEPVAIRKLGATLAALAASDGSAQTSQALRSIARRFPLGAYTWYAVFLLPFAFRKDLQQNE